MLTEYFYYLIDKRRQIEFKEKTDNFVKNLELDETLGQLLVAEGFSSIDDIKEVYKKWLKEYMVN